MFKESHILYETIINPILISITIYNPPTSILQFENNNSNIVDRLAYIDVNYNHVQCSNKKSAQLISDGIEKGLMCFDKM